MAVEWTQDGVSVIPAIALRGLTVFPSVMIHFDVSREISAKALDLRGLLSSLHLIEKGITSGEALKLGIINKAFDPFERQLVADAVWSRIPRDADRSKLFGN